MKAFTKLDAIAAPLPMANLDTDKILAGRFLKTISREGLGEKLFWALRQQPDFILNRSPWDRAGILIALDNFGCGSSREHAPWALLDFGIRCIIAPRFADIFYNNCFKNGILPIILPDAQVDLLMKFAADPTTARMSVDLATETIGCHDGRTIPFATDARRKSDLMQGIDEIGRSLGQADAIADFERRQLERQPWMRQILSEFR